MPFSINPFIKTKQKIDVFSPKRTGKWHVSYDACCTGESNSAEALPVMLSKVKESVSVHSFMQNILTSFTFLFVFFLPFEE